MKKMKEWQNEFINKPQNHLFECKILQHGPGFRPYYICAKCDIILAEIIEEYARNINTTYSNIILLKQLGQMAMHCVPGHEEILTIDMAHVKTCTGQSKFNFKRLLK